jgi:hypothetical protein
VSKNWKIKMRTVRPLSGKVLDRLNILVGLDDDNPREVAAMHRDLNELLRVEFPFLELHVDSVRPSTKLEGLARFLKRLDALIDTYMNLADPTWQELEEYYAVQPEATTREEAEIGRVLKEIASVASIVEAEVKEETRMTSQRHRPTRAARQELIARLMRMFAQYGPKKSESPKAERTEMVKFVRTVLEAAGIEHPKKPKAFRALIDRARRAPTSMPSRT